MTAHLNDLLMDMWVCHAKIERFRSMQRDTQDVDKQRLLARLLAEEEQKLADLMWVEQGRNRLVRLIVDRGARSVIESLLDDAVAIMGAAAGNIQAVDPQGDRLRIIASRGLPAPFLDYFAVVPWNENTVCAGAMLSRESVAVEDVEQCPIFEGKDSGRILLGAGIRAVQSMPLPGRDKHLLGMISTHWHSVTPPDPDRQKRLNGRIHRALDELRVI